MTATPAAATAVPLALPPTWTRWHTAGLLVIVLAIAALGVATPSLNLSKLATWIIMMLMFVVFLVIVGQGVTGRPQGLLIDERNKMSLSRLQMLLWTVTILSALLTIGLTNVSDYARLALQSGAPQASAAPFQPLAIAVPADVWLLMGISTTSLVGSPLLKSTKMSNGKIDTNGDFSEATFNDLFCGEETSNAGTLDLAKVQMFFFTLALVVSYAVMVGGVFAANNASAAATPITGLPDINQSMIALLGISHAGYLANKAIPRPDAPAQPAG